MSLGVRFYANLASDRHVKRISILTSLVLLKPKGKNGTMKRASLVLFLCLFAGGAANWVLAASPAAAAFQKLQSLAGDWEGAADGGGPVKSSFKSVASNTAVLETLNVSGMEEMLTLYSVDGNGIALVHYCPTNNQPRMRATPEPGDVKQLEFTFQGAGNLPSVAVGHEHKLVIEFRDKDHIIERWTWRKDGKDMEMVYHLARKTGN
jgi:hypothetical protein